MSDYINGSDLLLLIDGKPIGHCTSHTVTFNSETKDRAVKPAATQGKSAGLWKGKGVTGLTISVSGEGLRFIDETESGYAEVAPLWGAGTSVVLVAYKRGASGLTAGADGKFTPAASDIYMKGNFVISSLEETSPAQDDATYSVKLENDGEPDIYPGKAGGSISLNASQLTLEKNGSVTLSPTVSPSDATVTWSSSATGKATVSGGVVTGVAAGTAVITASITVNGLTSKDTCVVTVVEQP